MKKIFFLILMLFSIISYAKEIKIVIPYSSGGPTDRVTRIIIKYLNNDFYKFIPEYKLGAGGAIAANYVASVKNETVLMVTSNALVSNLLLSDVNNYNLENDFILVDYLGTEPLLLVVKSNNKINNFSDFINAGKKETLPYGSAGVGTSGHISSVIISQNDKNYIHIPYKGSSGLIVDLLNEELKWMLDSEINIGQFLLDNKIKPIAVYFNKRISKYSNIPTVKELGINDKNFYRWHILVSNKNADKDVIKYVSNKLQDPLLKNELEKIGIDTDKPKLENFLINEYIKTDKIIKELKIK